MAPVRTFVAVELPDAVGRALGATIDGLRRVVDGVRWVRPEGIHLTLKFLGDVEEAQIPEVVGAVGRAAGEVAPFALQTGGVGGFPRRGTGRGCSGLGLRGTWRRWRGSRPGSSAVWNPSDSLASGEATFLT